MTLIVTLVTAVIITTVIHVTAVVITTITMIVIILLVTHYITIITFLLFHATLMVISVIIGTVIYGTVVTIATILIVNNPSFASTDKYTLYNHCWKNHYHCIMLLLLLFTASLTLKELWEGIWQPGG